MYNQQLPPQELASQPLVQLPDIILGRPMFIPERIRPPAQMEPDYELVLSVIERTIVNESTMSPGHMFIFNQSAVNDFANQHADNIKSNVIQMVDQAMRVNPGDVGEVTQFVTKVTLASMVDKIARRDPGIGQMFDDNATRYVQDMLRDFHDFNNSLRGGRGGYGGSYDSGYNQYSQGGQRRGYAGYNSQQTPTSTTRTANLGTQYTTRTNQATPTPAKAPPKGAYGTNNTNHATAAQQPSTAQATAQVSAKDWNSSLKQPYKPLLPLTVPERYIRANDGVVYLATPENMGNYAKMDYSKHATQFGYVLPEAKHELRSKTSELVKSNIEVAASPGMSINGLTELTPSFVHDHHELYPVVDALAYNNILEEEADKISCSSTFGVMATVMYTNKDCVPIIAKLLESKNIRELHQQLSVLSKVVNPDATLPEFIIRHLDKQFTAMVNQLLTIQFSIEGLSIDSFIQDWNDLVVVLSKRGLDNLINPRLDKQFKTILDGFICLPKTETSSKFAVTKQLDKLLEVLSDDAIAKLEENAVVLLSPVTVTSVLLVAIDMNFDMKIGDSRSIQTSTHQWLFDLAEATLNSKNPITDSIGKSYFKTMDGYEFEISKGLMLDGSYLVTRIS